MKEQALAKLAAEFDSYTAKSESRYDPKAMMAISVKEALETFVRQDEEFAQAVVQGGTFADCMEEVAKDCKPSLSDTEKYRATDATAGVKVCGRRLSDLEAYKRAVQFYFPGADVEFQMKIRVNPHESGADDNGNDNAKDNGGITLNFADLFA